MASEILINVRPNQTRVAYVENRVFLDLKLEQRTSPTIVGSIYKGKVLRVLPGMQAAFVDIGLDKAAFLYVSDVQTDSSSNRSVVVVPGPGSSLSMKGDEESTDLMDPSLDSAADVLVESSTPVKEEKLQKIQDLLVEGQTLMVQVAKEPLGTKGARITTHISLPGRNIVYMPTLDHIGISRRIEDESERERLRGIIDAIKPEGGMIIRTAGEGVQEEGLKSDLDYLSLMWQEIQKGYAKKRSVGLVHSELDIELKALRDMLSPEVDRVIVDDRKTQKKIINFLSQFMPLYSERVELYDKPLPLFDEYDIDIEISRSLERKVWLKSGGYIVIDEAEALVVIDVNTGRYVGKKDLEDTILKTNLEAAREIAQQLRVRNCGGIIIVDFIDMEKELHREKVLERLQEEFNKDRTRVSVTSMSELGLVEMTRKRIRPSLVSMLCEPCTYCDGRSYIKSKATIANEIFHVLEREHNRGEKDRSIVVRCHAEVADWIYDEEVEALEYVETKIRASVALKTEPGYHIEQFEFTCY